MGRFVRPIFGNHSGKLSMRQKESGAAKVHTLVRRLWETGQMGKAFQFCDSVFSPVMFWPESLLTRAEMSADRQTVVRGPNFMGLG